MRDRLALQVDGIWIKVDTARPAHRAMIRLHEGKKSWLAQPREDRVCQLRPHVHALTLAVAELQQQRVVFEGSHSEDARVHGGTFTLTGRSGKPVGP